MLFSVIDIFLSFRDEDIYIGNEEKKKRQERRLYNLLTIQCIVHSFYNNHLLYQRAEIGFCFFVF